MVHDVLYHSQPLTPTLSACSFFPIRHEVLLCFGIENLCRDFCLFTPDDRYVILASADSSSNATEYSRPVQSNANPHSLTGLSSLDEVRFHVVDMERGKATDKLEFTHDYILLSNHAGVAMNGRKFGVLSLENQLIKIFEITLAGKFVECGIVGYKLDIEDSEAFPPVSNGSHPLLGLKQRLFGHLFQRAQAQRKPYMATRILYNNWDIIESLCISRFQFLDQDHILVKLVCPEALSLRTRSATDSGLQNTAFFIVYSLETTRILSFHRSTSLVLLLILLLDGSICRNCMRPFVTLMTTSESSATSTLLPRRGWGYRGRRRLPPTCTIGSCGNGISCFLQPLVRNWAKCMRPNDC